MMNQQKSEVGKSSLYDNIEHEWPVRVYRKLLPVVPIIRTSGGEPGCRLSKNQFPSNDGESNNPSIQVGRWQRLIPQNEKKEYVLLKATPRPGCIVLKRIQVRLKLAKIATSTTTSTGTSSAHQMDIPTTNNNGNGCTSTDPETTKNSTLVVRRKDCILISTTTITTKSNTKINTICHLSSSNRSLVLKFYNEFDCIQFSIRFLQLNPPPPPQLYVVDGRMKPSAGSRMAIMATKDDRNNNEQQQQSAAAFVDSSSTTMSYISRLLYDDDFCDFVNKMEDTIMSSNDGSSLLLQALSNGGEEQGVKP